LRIPLPWLGVLSAILHQIGYRFSALFCITSLLAAITLISPVISGAQQAPNLPRPEGATPAQLAGLFESGPATDFRFARAGWFTSGPVEPSTGGDNSFDAAGASTDGASSLRAKDASDQPPPRQEQRKRTPESEIALEGMVSYGNWQIFAAGTHEALYTGGLEYDRHSWGKFVGAQMDYAAEVLPLVFLKEPAVLNPYGIDRSKRGDFVILHGLAFSPIGLRMQWRHNKAFKPYFTVMGGAIGFTKKALSPDASYYDFSLRESIGFYLKMSEHLDMRFGLFGDFHFSNAYITNYNPGLDVMNSSLAVSYHFGG